MVSIVIPTLNEEKILERTLKALRVPTDFEYEIIVSDGRSIDRTLEIAHAFADKVVVHDGLTRQTIGGGRNAGARAAAGDFILFLDADVFIPNLNEFFATTTRLFQTRKNLVGLTVFLKVLPENVTLSDKLFFALINRLNQFSNNFLNVGTSSGECMMIPVQIFNSIGGFNEHLVMGEDNDLFSRLSKVGKTRVVPGLHVLHTSRRAHKVGWPVLLGTWWLNLLFNKLRGRSLSREWKVIR